MTARCASKAKKGETVMRIHIAGLLAWLSCSVHAAGMGYDTGFAADFL